jgi:prepilin-type N-terminal cleavage/methylation domain-containing protein
LNLEAHTNRAFDKGIIDMNSRFRQILLGQILSHLNNKREQGRSGGFTLIELLVVIIIVGVLSAIALPSFLNQSIKAKQSEAKAYVSALYRGQYTYYSEKATFTNNITNLGVGISTATTNYQYASEGNPTLLETRITNKATSRKVGIKSYAGVLVIVKSPANEAVLKHVICNSQDSVYIAGGTPIPNGDLDIGTNEPICPTPGFSVDE